MGQVGETTGHPKGPGIRTRTCIALPEKVLTERQATEFVAAAKRGALLYMRQEGRGIGLFNKIRAYRLQDEGLDTVEANLRLGFPSDGRHYGLCADIMCELGISKVILMTNNPAKIDELREYGIDVVSREPLEYGRNSYNENYLNTKEKKMGHLLHHQD